MVAYHNSQQLFVWLIQLPSVKWEYKIGTKEQNNHNLGCDYFFYLTGSLVPRPSTAKRLMDTFQLRVNGRI